MWKDYDKDRPQDIRRPQNNPRKGLNSPNYERSRQNDYNSYMLMKKYKVEENRMKTSNQVNDKRHQNKTKRKHQQYDSAQEIVAKLVKQNDYLLDEVMRYKQEVAGYQQAIGRLRRCKSQRNTASLDNISIVDQQNLNHSNLIQSKLLKSSTLAASTVVDRPNFKVTKSELHRLLLDQTTQSSNHNKKALQLQIQQQNDKLYTLIQQFGSEKDIQKRRRSRLQMSACAQRLKYLRNYYKQLLQ